jgi:hypothetical protein
MPWYAPKIDWDPPDAVANTDLNEIGENLVYLKAHADDVTAPVHGSTDAATASTIVHRDAAGNAKMAAPLVPTDIAILSTVTDHSLLTNNPHTVTKAQVGLGSVTNDACLPLAGGTMTGVAVGHVGTDYTTYRFRNVALLAAAPGVGDGSNGDVAFVYV